MSTKDKNMSNENYAGSHGIVISKQIEGLSSEHIHDGCVGVMDDDFKRLNDYLWCEDCRSSYKNDCQKHGKYNVIKDKVIPSRAKLTTPHQLVVRNLEYRAGNNHVYGTFARRIIQKRTQFGPYEGDLVDHWNSDKEDKIILKIFLNSGGSCYLDCTDEEKCNWMMFVRPARTLEEQNLAAFQHQESIYFVTTKIISNNEELKVWYADDYAKMMGYDILREPQPTPPSPSLTEQVFLVDEDFLRPPYMKIARTKQKLPSVQEAFKKPMDNKLRTLANVALKPKDKRIVLRTNNLTNAESTVSSEYVLQTIESVDETAGEASDNTKYVLVYDTGTDTSMNAQLAEDTAYYELMDTELPEHSDTEAEMAEQDLVMCPICQKKLPYNQPHYCRQAPEVSRKAIVRTGLTRKGKSPLNRFLQKKIKDEDTVDVGQTAASVEVRVIGASEENELALNEHTIDEMMKTSQMEENQQPQMGGQSPLVRRKKKMSERKPGQYLPCDVCGKAYSSKEKLMEHMFEHTGERPFFCGYKGCGRAFISKFKLKRHVTIHGVGDKFHCPYCDRVFGRKDHLKNHLKIHDPNKLLFTCDECQKQYASPFAFKIHIAFHKAERGELDCFVCNGEFGSKEDLLHHLKVHSGSRALKDESEKVHECTVCHKTFFTPKDVRRHSVVHTKQREYMCHQCPRKFGRKDHLVRHMRTAHNKKTKLTDIDQDQTQPENSETTKVVKSVGKKKKIKKKKKVKSLTENKESAIQPVTDSAAESTASPEKQPSLQSQPTVIINADSNTNNSVEMPSSSSSPDKKPDLRSIAPQVIRTPPSYSSPPPANIIEVVPNQQIVMPLQGAQIKIQPVKELHSPPLSDNTKPTAIKSPKKAQSILVSKQVNIQQPLPDHQYLAPSQTVMVPVASSDTHFSVPSLSGASFNIDNISLSGLVGDKAKSMTRNVQNQLLEELQAMQTKQGAAAPTVVSAAPVSQDSFSALKVQPLQQETGNMQTTLAAVNDGSSVNTAAEQLVNLQMLQLVSTTTNSGQPGTVTVMVGKPTPTKPGQPQPSSSAQPVVSYVQSSGGVVTATTQSPSTNPPQMLSYDSDAVKIFFAEEQAAKPL